MIAWIKKLKDKIFNAGGEAVGRLEVAFPHLVKYPVHAYSEPVEAGKLWRGSRPSEDDLRALAEQGFKTVVNLCAEQDFEATPGQGLGLFMVYIPVVDNTAPSAADIREFLMIVTDSEHQPGFVHCEAGIGRTGCFCAAYRVFAQGWTPAMALTEAQQFGLAIPAQIEFIKNLGDLAQ